MRFPTRGGELSVQWCADADAVELGQDALVDESPRAGAVSWSKPWEEARVVELLGAAVEEAVRWHEKAAPFRRLVGDS